MIPHTPVEIVWMVLLAIGSLCGACAPVLLAWVLRGQRDGRVQREAMHQSVHGQLESLNTKVALQNGRVTRIETRVNDVEEDLKWLTRRVGGA